jgi:hypothetical protein
MMILVNYCIAGIRRYTARSARSQVHRVVEVLFTTFWLYRLPAYNAYNNTGRHPLHDDFPQLRGLVPCL